ncbi:hypothetical protein BX659_102175 [Orenia metallireducens]|jgi:hypothetical protein|uniref:DUF7164 domain-containing protein n=1 Tax=Orenia metallireducens TaxID=1413210 RepID=UPI000D069B52|nr:hypothetical protein [Orenia metallireducens]PRX34859.1 hypothetical protein BX659_102175 [Orenia metallireducens]
MRRAIVVFVEDKRKLKLQFQCLYTSYKHIQSEDTDLVVFGTKSALKWVADDCIKVEYGVLSDPAEFLKYRFINSISCLVGSQADFLDDYDLILRTDVDTFLTPAWNSFYPQLYTVGRGQYTNNDEVRDNIKRIAKHFGLRHQGIHNLGSTHYGKARLVRSVCTLALSISEYLLTTEFKVDKGAWPGWYRGLTTMYSCEIAVNHLVNNFVIDGDKLDYGSTGSDSIDTHPHIHCWHTKNMFSKGQFKAGNYNHLSTENLDIDKVRNYCLYMALKSQEVNR